MNNFMSQINGPDLLNNMINGQEFAEEIIYTPKNLSAVTFNALYQEPTIIADGGTEANAVSNIPSVIVRALDITWKISNADTISIRGKSFKVVDFVDEKFGTIELFLHRN